MDVRRLRARLRALLVDSGAAVDAPTDARATVGSPASQWSGVTRRARNGSVANWLADGRRLRPRARLSARQGGALDERAHEDQLASRQNGDRRDALRPASARVTVPREPVVQGSPLPAVPAADGTAHSRATGSGPTSSLPALPPDIRVDFTGELSAATLAAIEQLDATQRRLIFLRYLVEQGVYNEGFGAHPLPEQYWRSRRRGEQPGE